MPAQLSAELRALADGRKWTVSPNCLRCVCVPRLLPAMSSVPAHQVVSTDGSVSDGAAGACAEHEMEDEQAEEPGWFRKALHSGGSAFLIAFICNKATFPIRAPITVGLTPVVARCVARALLLHRSPARALHHCSDMQRPHGVGSLCAAVEARADGLSLSTSLLCMVLIVLLMIAGSTCRFVRQHYGLKQGVKS